MPTRPQDRHYKEKEKAKDKAEVKEKVKGKVRTRAKEKEKERTKENNPTLTIPKKKEIRAAEASATRICYNEDCPYVHLSQDQVNRALGRGGYQRDSSCDSTGAGQSGRGKGRGKG